MDSTLVIVSLYALLLGAYYIYADDPSFYVRRAADGVAIVCVVIAWMLRRKRLECYLLDFSCYRPSDERKLNAETSIYFGCEYQPPVPENLELQWRVFLRSGLGEETYGAPVLFDGRAEGNLEEGRMDVHECFAAVLDHLFSKTDIHPDQIDIVVVTVSTFSPVPSHASWIVNHYKMKESVKAFMLSGMGCSANVVGVAMAKDLLGIYPDSYALVVGTESTTINANYLGKDKSMMIANCLFRVGGTALLFSNKPREARRAKLQLLDVVLTNVSSDDEAYDCVIIKEDDDGYLGTSLLPRLITVATKAMTRNLSILGPKVLPLTEMLYYTAHNTLCIKFLRMKLDPYVPNFRLAFRHFCIQPGGRAVVNGIGNNLRLTDFDMEPSRMALHRFGNTSVSGIWYEVAYMEAKGRLKPGDRLLQIALGAGFQCNTAIWKVMRESHPYELFNNVWNDCIHRYPCDPRHRFTDDYCRVYLDAFTRHSQDSTHQ